MALKLSIGQVALLKSLILQYIELRVQLFPNVNLRPKHHFLVHYPYLIKKFGPLRFVWTMRYESKHRFFKNILKHSPNFKNVIKMLSEKHQLLQSLHITQGGLFSDKVIADEAVHYLPGDYDPAVAQCISDFCHFHTAEYITGKAVFRGITYTTGMHLCCEKSERNDFVLCSLDYIVINSSYDDLFFVEKKIEIFFNQFSILIISMNLLKMMLVMVIILLIFTTKIYCQLCL